MDTGLLRYSDPTQIILTMRLYLAKGPTSLAPTLPIKCVLLIVSENDVFPNSHVHVCVTVIMIFPKAFQFLLNSFNAHLQKCFESCKHLKVDVTPNR